MEMFFQRDSGLVMIGVLGFCSIISINRRVFFNDCEKDMLYASNVESSIVARFF